MQIQVDMYEEEGEVRSDAGGRGGGTFERHMMVSKTDLKSGNGMRARFVSGRNSSVLTNAIISGILAMTDGAT